jgi:hypothetical protein
MRPQTDWPYCFTFISQKQATYEEEKRRFKKECPWRHFVEKMTRLGY